MNVDRLPALEQLSLSKPSKSSKKEMLTVSGQNNLETLEKAFRNPLPALVELDVSQNKLSRIDVANVPGLCTLNLDNNSIAQITSVHGHTRLQSLSWRFQALPTSSPFSEVQYQACRNLRNLYLSGNNLTSFAPAWPFLNLTTLELSSTGLQRMSEDFGSQCPSLRILNLNFNSIQDLRPLLGMVGLQKLYLAGNRISRLRNTAAILKLAGSELEELDLRQNPLSLPFYSPALRSRSNRLENQLVVHSARGPTSPEASDLDINAQSKADEAQHLLLPAENDFDKTCQERLDEPTKLRRQVYEMLVVTSCKSLKTLDGLEIDRKVFRKHGEAWNRLTQLRILKRKVLEGESFLTS